MTPKGSSRSRRRSRCPGGDRDRAAGRQGDGPGGPAGVCQLHQGARQRRNEGAHVLGFSGLADAAFGLTVPPGHAMIAATAAVSTKDDPYACARLKRRTGGRGSAGSVMARLTFPLSGYHTYRFINVPAGAESFAVDLELTRGDRRKGRLIGPDGKPVTGVRMLWSDEPVGRHPDA